MPYQPYDTGWIKSIYGGLCLLWLLCWNGSLPHLRREAYIICYNHIFTPFSKIFNRWCMLLGEIIISFGYAMIQIESAVFKHFNYIDPIFNGIKHIESLLANIKIDTGPPSFHFGGHLNTPRHRTSSGKHLCVYYARKRRLKRRQIIVPGSTYYKSKNDNKTSYKDPVYYDYSTNDHTFHPSNDSSCQINEWYDAISPYWTGGMVWSGAYVLGHQVVSVTTDPIFVSDIPLLHELSATIQAPKARSEGENVSPRTSIALDSGSSIHIFKDNFLLQDITEDDSKMIGVRTTDSRFKINKLGNLCDDLMTLPLPSEGYYYYPKGVANILSLAMIAETKRVVMDTAIDNAFYVFNEDGTYIRFARTNNGMYCIDIGADDNDTMVMAHQTVKGESAKFSALDCRRAEKIRDLQEVLACPSDFDLANAVEHNVIGNNPFTRRDVRIAKQIFGPDEPAMKGKTVKRKSKMPREDEISDLPPNIIKEYTDVHLSIDVMHVNGIRFLISYSKHIGLLQTYCVRKNNRETILDCISMMMKTYRSRNIFRVVTIEADGAFDSIRHELQDEPYQVALSICDADRHVEIVERQIRFLKERIRAVRLMMPYKKLPKRFTIEMVHSITKLINSLPKQNGIHTILSPREIVTGKKFRCPTVRIGQYVQGHTGGTNSTDQERSIDALYLGRADNGSGHSVFKLSTKQVVSVNRVTVIPTSEATSKVVNDIGRQEEQPEGIEFSDINGRITLQDFADNANDDDSNASDDDFEMDDEYRNEMKNDIEREEEEGIIGNDDPDIQEDHFQNPIEQHNNNVMNNNEPVSTIIPKNNRNPIMALTNATNPEIQECDKRKKKEAEDDDQAISIEDSLDDGPMILEDTKLGVGSTDDNSTASEDDTPRGLDSDLGPYWALAQTSQAYVLNTIATYSNIEASKSTPQYGFNKGLKEFGSLGYEATVKELDDNLLGMGAVQMLKPSEVGNTIRYEALNYLMFLKRKRCGTVKARGCADGRPQREYIRLAK
jgi:hypothetical protein